MTVAVGYPPEEIPLIKKAAETGAVDASGVEGSADGVLTKT